MFVRYIFKWSGRYCLGCWCLQLCWWEHASWLRRYCRSCHIINKNYSRKRFQWPLGNQIKSNSGKCHIIISTNEPVNIQIGSQLIVRSNYQNLLKVKIDHKLNFNEHVETACVKDNKKLTALARATLYMSTEEEDW